MQPKSKFKAMTKIFFRKVRHVLEDRVDIRSLSFDEYRMLVSLIQAASKAYENGYKAQPVGPFNLTFIDIRVFAHLDSLNTLAKLKKIICV